MRVAFARAMRWYFVAFFIAFGTTALLIAEETGSMRPVAFVLLGYGFAYVIGTLWKDLRDKILAYSIGVFLFCTIISSYMNDIIFILSGYNLEINKYVLWFACLTLIGIPAMTYVFRKVRL